MKTFKQGSLALIIFFIFALVLSPWNFLLAADQAIISTNLIHANSSAISSTAASNNLLVNEYIT